MSRENSARREAPKARSVSQFIGFFGVILVLTGLAWLTVASFVHDLVPGGWPTIALAWLLSVTPLFILVYNISTGCYPSAALRVYVFRTFWYAQLLMLPLAIISGVIGVVMLPFGLGDEAGRLVVLGGGALMIAMGIWGYVGSLRLVVKHVTLTPNGMPPALDGLRIVQLSDLHVGPHTPRGKLARIARATVDAQPHVIAYTGDQVDDYPHDVDDLGEAFGHLRAPLGTFAIAGNHDIYAGWSEVRRGLEQLGITVLVNDSVRLTHNGADFWLAGTGDPAGLQFMRGTESGAPDVARTLEHVPAGGFTIVLAHNPALFIKLAEHSSVGAVLSGHTHHGQFSIPSKNWSLANLFLEFAMGTYERNGSLLYVSPGANYWGIPFRIGSLPEVSVITLRGTGNGEGGQGKPQGTG